MNKPICKISNARGVTEGLWERGDVETLIDVLTAIEYTGFLISTFNERVWQYHYLFVCIKRAGVGSLLTFPHNMHVYCCLNSC